MLHVPRDRATRITRSNHIGLNKGPEVKMWSSLAQAPFMLAFRGGVYLCSVYPNLISLSGWRGLGISKGVGVPFGEEVGTTLNPKPYTREAGSFKDRKVLAGALVLCHLQRESESSARNPHAILEGDVFYNLSVG